MYYFEFNKVRKKAPFWSPSTWHQSRLPPSAAAPPAAANSGETRVRIASKSAIHPWNSRRRRPPHAPTRASFPPRDFRRVLLTRRRTGVGSCPFRSRQPRRHLLDLFQASNPASGKSFGQPLCVCLSCVRVCCFSS
ncbi:hypothetical protein GmHk_07G019517 [Glycine max]|nr:hypothetical protein GmHk_07G019517 [Glycine max]